MNDFLDYFRTGLARASSNLPRSLGRKVYGWPVMRLRSLLELGPDQLWTRNSLALDYWELGASDIDLSVWVDGEAKDCLAVWHKLLPHRSLLLGGEVHVYSASLVRKLLPLANPWELRRDPHLIRKTGYGWKPDLGPAATVFLVRMLRADRRLRQDPLGRQRKWRDHLGALGIDHPDLITWDFVVDQLAARAPFAAYPREELDRELQHEGPHDDLAAGDLGRLLRANHHNWGNYVQADDDRFLAALSDEGHAFLAATLAWEIWGLSPLTQVVCGLELADLPGTWRILRWLTENLRVTTEMRRELGAGVRDLEEFYRFLVSP